MPEVHFVGTVHSGQDFGVRSAYVRTRVVPGGSGWSCLAGDEASHSQTAMVEECEDELVWAHPLDVWYSVSTLDDWPLLLVSVWQQDELERHEIAGYGVARLPTCPGMHFMDIVTWRPEGTRLQEIAAWFRGGLPQLTDTSVVTEADQRYLLRTISTGTVQVEVQVLLKGFEEHGVEFGGA